MISLDDPEVIESLKYLLVPKEERIRCQAQPFDAKKQCFVPEHKEGFVAAEITGKEGNLTVCRTVKGDVVKVKEDDIQQMNPPKYEKCDDMADLTYLNDATVLHNLRTRYMAWYIYV
jgi:myosin heavy chain 6/7